ncbi:hypothetical protein CAEBREN_17810 [Caenorhabditis brenneri]|uniref:Amino acid transporter transmembrane domain-containing protein n=1 Tax=Caenorhabditis brenneri TaxID=135651 RepID=G0MKJ8_CAEBE|nr:hypothetical protein CAEBREN_17810 [Caenorhabditis brenneri]
MASNRFQNLQNWTNKHVFSNSLDYWNQELHEVPSYQNQQASDGGGNQPPDRLETIDESYVSEQPQPQRDDVIKTVETEDDGHGASSEPISALQAAWNVTNAIQGMFIVGLPIAVKIGGWWSVGAMIAVAYVCYWTGVLLIECLYEDGVKKRKTYREIADFYKPGFGKWVLAAQLTELLSTCIIYLVLAADLLQSCFPSVDKPGWMMIVSASLLTCSFLDDLQIVSRLSFFNAISHLIVNLIMMIYCLSFVSQWSFSSITFSLNINTLPTIVGMVVFGYTSHIFLPNLEGNMKNPSEFNMMLKWSHIAAAIFKVVFGMLGFLTFGELTQQEISNSLPNQSFKILVNLILVVKALLSYPLPFYAAVQLLKNNLFLGYPQTPFTSCYSPDKSLREWAVTLRIILVLFTLFVALSVPYLVELMGLVGNITGTMLSFIWPALFHLHIKQKGLNNFDKRFDQGIIIMGCSVCLSGVYFSSMELLRAINSSDSIN